MKHIYTTLLLMAYYISANAYSNLTVSDPRTWGGSGRGKIDSATLTIKPHGAYFEYGLYLTISGGQMASYNDTTEIILDFDLPQGSFIEDSWLWIGNDVVKADLIERNIANSIYEGIVQRRQDPSILFKESAISYKLRVFPLPPGQSRMVKISYLVPVNWRSTGISAPIPLEILKTSTQVPTLTILVYGDSLQNAPTVAGINGNAFFVGTGNFVYKTTILSAQVNSSSQAQLQLTSPMQGKIFASVYPVSANTGYYQLAVNRNAVIDTVPTPESKKVLLLLDYLNMPNDMTAAEVLAEMRIWLQAYFEPTDSFNFMYGHNYITKYSDTWVPCSQINIDGLAAYSFSAPNASYTNVPLLLQEGIDFIQSNPNPDFSQILLVSNSNTYANANVDSLADDIYNQTLPNIIRINTINYTTYITGSWYGNHHLYTKLAAKTDGQYQKIMNAGTHYQTINYAAYRLFVSPEFNNTFDLFNIHADFENGFTYAEYASYNSDDNTDVIIGKYYGEAPLKLELTGIANEIIKHKEFTFNTFNYTDSFARKMWVSKWLAEKEATNLTAPQAREVKDSSIANRVLSRYTAFLALEPTDTFKICAVCLAPNDPVLISVSEVDESGVSLTAYPNPFSGQINITIQLADVGEIKSLKLYNLLGQQVHSFDVSQLQEKQMSISWNSAELNAGVYILNLETTQGIKTIRLVKE